MKESLKPNKRSADQIAIDALTVEKAKLQMQLEKVRADLNATPWVDLIAVRKAALSLDCKTTEGLAELEKLAKQEAKHLAALKRFESLDTEGLYQRRFSLESEIHDIDSMLFTYSMRASRGREIPNVHD